MRISSEDADVAGLLTATAAAKRRIAVAAEAMGKIVHSHTFDTSGSTKAVMELRTACKL